MMELWNYLLYGHAPYVQKHLSSPSYRPYMHIYICEKLSRFLSVCKYVCFMTFSDVHRTVLGMFSSCCSCWMWTWAPSSLIFLGCILVFLDFDLFCATVNIKCLVFWELSFFLLFEISPQRICAVLHVKSILLHFWDGNTASIFYIHASRY